MGRYDSCISIILLLRFLYMEVYDCSGSHSAILVIYISPFHKLSKQLIYE